MKRYKERNRNRINELERIRRNQPHVKRKLLNNIFLKRYGITLEERDALIRERLGRCDICNRETSKPNVDHDPVTMKIRGILCNQCNQAIGLLKHDRFILQNAINYLSK